MKQLNVTITSGGTREYIDDVRVLSNISTGKLGSKIAEKFISHGHKVTYVSPSNATKPTGDDYSQIIVTNTLSLMEVMRVLVPKSDVVIQSMAVSDFTFDLKEETKISSDSPEAFIEHLRKTIIKTPKVIANFRSWNPNAILVGFKFTVGKSKDELVSIANRLMIDNDLNMVLANDKVQMKKSGEHVGILIMRDWKEQLRNKNEIAENIYSNVVRLAGG